MVFKSSGVKKKKVFTTLAHLLHNHSFVFTVCLSPAEVVVGAECC